MNGLVSALNSGSGRLWLFLPTAILLGALHGLEPGHSKTMMAAFIVAVRGTIRQAALLGLSAAFSHSLIIWALAAGALYFGRHFNVESTEPYFQLGSGILVLATAGWMAWRTRKEVLAEAAHDHAHGHEHHHHGEENEYQDDHEKAHALEIRTRFANRQVTTGQIVLFGLSGGLLPCPAAFSILILCLQLKKFTLGFSLVLCFSIGLALTLVGTGVIAAWGMKQASRKLKGFDGWARRAPYLSSAVLTLVGGYLLVAGLRQIL